MPLKDCTHWIFDMDGTLTMPIHDFEDIRRQLGITSKTPILEAIAAMPDEEATNVSRHLHDIEMDIAKQAVAQPGAHKLLERITKTDGHLGILTRNDEEIAVATLQACGLDRFFDEQFIVGREMCPPKPSPDGVFHLLSLWDAAPSRTVMVGDYLYDIEAGRRGGVHTVHLDQSRQFEWPELADHKIGTLHDLIGLIDDE